MVDLGRDPNPQLQQQGGPALTPGAPEVSLSAEEQRAASAGATQGVDRPVEAEAPSPEVLQDFSPAPDAPAPAAPAPAPATSERTVGEMAQDPAVREALQKALDANAFRVPSLREAVKTGLETGEFRFASAGQERTVKSVIADAIDPKPVPANSGRQVSDPNAAVKPEGRYDQAIKAAIAQQKELPAPANPELGYTNAEAKQMAKDGLIEIPREVPLEEALKHVAEKLPDGLDGRVAAALRANPEFGELKNDRPDPKAGFQNSKPAISDAVRYANQMAVKTGDFEPASIEAHFQHGLGQATRDELNKLAENNGVKLYPEVKNDNRREPPANDPAAAVKQDGKYDRAIKAALADPERAAKLPAPANQELGYTNAEAKAMLEGKLIAIEGRAKETPGKGQTPELATADDARAIVDYLNAGNGKDGAKGVPFDIYKTMGFKAKNELASIVKTLTENPDAGVQVTANLAKEFKEKALIA